MARILPALMARCECMQVLHPRMANFEDGDTLEVWRHVVTVSRLRLLESEVLHPWPQVLCARLRTASAPVQRAVLEAHFGSCREEVFRASSAILATLRRCLMWPLHAVNLLWAQLELR